MIRSDKDKDGLLHIWDSVIEENGWVIVEQNDHRWALYENAEFMEEPFMIYANHELGAAIVQGQKWT